MHPCSRLVPCGWVLTQQACSTLCMTSHPGDATRRHGVKQLNAVHSSLRGIASYVPGADLAAELARGLLCNSLTSGGGSCGRLCTASGPACRPAGQGYRDPPHNLDWRAQPVLAATMALWHYFQGHRNLALKYVSAAGAAFQPVLPGCWAVQVVLPFFCPPPALAVLAQRQALSTAGRLVEPAQQTRNTGQGLPQKQTRFQYPTPVSLGSCHRWHGRRGPAPHSMSPDSCFAVRRTDRPLLPGPWPEGAAKEAPPHTRPPADGHQQPRRALSAFSTLVTNPAMVRFSNEPEDWHRTCCQCPGQRRKPGQRHCVHAPWCGHQQPLGQLRVWRQHHAACGLVLQAGPVLKTCHAPRTCWMLYTGDTQATEPLNA